MASTLEEIRNIRLEKVKKLTKMGINPYPSQAEKTHSNKEILDNFEKFEGKKVTIAGRLMSWREHGALVFGHIQDETGKIQLFIKEDSLQKTDTKACTLGFSDLELVDVGDFLEVNGEVAKTSRGEISVIPETLKILSKSLRPLPEKWEGIKDPEIIFRRRYLDLTMNPARMELFRRKSMFWQSAREFMNHHGFLEVETPVMEHVTGGADAKPFITHHNALDEDFYLRISTELYLKRLVGGGYEKVYTLGPNFRNEGIDEEHLQEYSQLEWYWAYADYRDNMELVKDLYRTVAKKVYGKTEFSSRGFTFDLAGEWEEIDYVETIKEKLGVNVFDDSEEKMLAVIKENGVILERGAINRARLADNLWKVIRKTVAGPAFLINTPKFISPLAKSVPGKEEVTERFQVILAGSELGNGYSELNDPVDQLMRFREQQSARESGDEEAQMLDIDYVEMLEYGMPPTSGFGVSERLFWFLEDIAAREGVFFPQMKRKIDPLTAKIYGMKEK